MTTAIRNAQTENAIIEISLTRKVNDKVANLDGDRFVTGREVYESYDVKITSKKNGKSIKTFGKPGGFAFFKTADQFTKLPAGAHARIGDAYISKEIYDIAMVMISELDAEVSRTDEQVEIEHAEVLRTQAEDRLMDLEAAEYARQIKNGLCPKCGTYCYGDCEAN